MNSIVKSDLSRRVRAEDAVRTAFARGLTPDEAQAAFGITETDWAEALNAWASLFAEDKHRSVLCTKRRAALGFMRLAREAFPDLLLAGRVAAGTATESSPILLTAQAPGLREAAIRLLNLGIESDPIDGNVPDPDPAYRGASEPCGLAFEYANEMFVLRIDLPDAPLRKGRPIPEAPRFSLPGAARGTGFEALCRYQTNPTDPQDGLAH